MSRKKAGLSTDIKVRLTEAEKDLLRRASARHGVDMSVLCRSVIVDYLTNDPTQREQMISLERTIVDLMAHVTRTRALVNADLHVRYKGLAEKTSVEELAAIANDLELSWIGVTHDA